MDGQGPRSRLGEARLMLLFTPQLCGARDPLDVLARVLPWIDAIQVRIKPLGAAAAVSLARELFEWTERVLTLARGRALVLVNDRVDVCAVLAAEAAGVHLGQSDTPAADARSLLGPAPLIGLSTHTQAQVVQGAELPIDYLGFGPVFPTPTKGYARGLGPEAAWIASQGSPLPLFPIGGITPENASELEPVGRACVGSAILGAPDPARAAQVIRAALAG